MNPFVNLKTAETTIELMPGVHLHRRPTALHVESDHELSCLGSAVLGGGALRARHIINLGVPSQYRCGRHLDDLECAARELGIASPFVGLLTAARLEDAQVSIEHDEVTTVAAIVTLGISHPTAAGVSTAVQRRNGREVGTINTIVLVDGRLAPGAHVNALITATEAKSLALVECSVRTPEGHLASGTGTDALVVACTDRGAWFEYGGPISTVGALLGRAVRSATLNALFVWHARQQLAEAAGATAPLP
ncbi:MAG: adenosylcobinamide amidohydrolase [Caldilineales bacterium]|nr:adenosylcobinamide amidohydrolase [Caldilineales bacterium]